MARRKYDYKAFLGRKNQFLIRHKRIISDQIKNNQNNVAKIDDSNFREKKVMKAPSHFSLKDNYEETVSFFNDVWFEIENRQKYKLRLIFDMSNVEKVTNDAIIYYIALLMNIKKDVHLEYQGNFPKNKDAYLFFVKSGFLNYVKIKNKPLQPNTDFFEIRCGNENNLNIVAQICDFVKSKYHYPRKTLELYAILVELMGNAKAHAYTNFSKTLPNWYVSLENRSDRIIFTFMDTGVGIPTTVNKKFIFEQFVVDDSALIESALTSNYPRSTTLLTHRGHGLNDFYTYYLNHKIHNLHVISKKGYVKFDEDNRICSLSREMHGSIRGSLFYWELKKETV